MGRYNSLETALGLVALAAVACGGAVAPTPTPAPAPRAAPTPTQAAAGATAPTPAASPTIAAARPAATPTPAAAAARRPAGSLVIALNSLAGEATSPIESTGQTEQAIFEAIYDRLVTTGVDGKPAAALATGWRISADGLTWNFDLRPGVKWHDGSQFTSQDVLFGLETGFAEPGVGILEKNVDLPRSHDSGPLGVLIQTRDPFPGMISIISQGTYPLPRDYYQRVGREAFKRAPVGTGPYRLVSHAIGERMSFKANENYWDGPPFVDRVIYAIVPEASTRLAMLKTGEADIAGQLTPTDAIEAGKGRGLRVIRSPMATLVFGHFVAATRQVAAGQFEPDTLSPLNDVRVRQAINYLVDRQGIAQSLFQGFAAPAATLNKPFYTGADTSLKPLPFDPQKARQLLADAGYSKGFSLTIDTAETGASPYVPQIAQSLQSTLTQAGLRVTVRKVDYATLLLNRRTRKTEGIAMAATGSFYDAWYDMTIHNLCGFYSSLCDTDFERRVQEAGRLRDYQEFLRASQALDRETYEKAHNVHIIFGDALWGANDRIVEWPQRPGWAYVAFLNKIKIG